MTSLWVTLGPSTANQWNQSVHYYNQFMVPGPSLTLASQNMSIFSSRTKPTTKQQTGMASGPLTSPGSQGGLLNIFQG